MHNNIRLEVYQNDWLPGFAAFLHDGKMKKEARAHLVINIENMVEMANRSEAEKPELPYVIAEALTHEVFHAIEAWAEVEFSEERVEALIDKYRKANDGEHKTKLVEKVVEIAGFCCPSCGAQLDMETIELEPSDA